MAVKLSNITHFYELSHSRWTLNIVDWVIKKNERIFIHGPSGSGKTTLLRIIAGLLSPAVGSVSIFDERLDLMTVREKDRFRALNIGFVFQQFNLIPYLSAFENVCLAQKFSGKRANVSNSFKLFSKLNIDKNDLHRPAQRLSVGQQQRVAIVRAMINQPKLLIVDEPTSSLDSKNKDDFMNLLMDYSDSQGITLLFVSHDLGLSSYFGKVLALSEIMSKSD